MKKKQKPHDVDRVSGFKSVFGPSTKTQGVLSVSRNSTPCNYMSRGVYERATTATF